MASVWQNNKMLRNWERKKFKENCNGDFNYNLAYPLEDPLVNAISKYINVDKKYIYVGAGISQFIGSMLGLKCWDRIFLSNIEFNLYKRTANIYGKDIKFIESIHIKDFMKKMENTTSKESDLMCISSPRWFSGEIFSKENIKRLLTLFKGTIIIDEAYIDFSDNPNGMMDLCMKNDRIIIFRSFSKKFLASGFRVGYMVTKKEIVGMRNTVIPPHSISSYSENFFVNLLNDKKILNAFDDTRNYIILNREMIYEEFKKEKKFEIFKSNSNFITIMFNDKNLMERIYNNLMPLAGIQKFDDSVPFIKIWINNKKFSKVVIQKIKEIIE